MSWLNEDKVIYKGSILHEHKYYGKAFAKEPSEKCLICNYKPDRSQYNNKKKK